MEVRPALGIVAGGVLAGELVTAVAPGAPALLSVAAIAALGASLVVRRAAALHVTLALVALAAGALRMGAVTAPAFPAYHVARLALPRRTTLIGRVVAPPLVRERSSVLIVETEAIGEGDRLAPASGRVRLTLRGDHGRWRFGDRLAVDATLRRPRNFDNPGGFDWVGHLARRGIHVTASSWGPDAVRRLFAPRRGLRVRLERWRARLAASIARTVPSPEGAVLRALVVGDETGIDHELREAFTRAGVVHVLSVSGLHITLVATAGWIVARWLLSRSETLLLGYDVARLAAVASLGPVALYAAVAGLGVATLRAAVMVAAAVGGTLLGRRVDVLRSLALAALLIALASPGTPLDIGFQLSFVSVLAIVCGMRRLLPHGRRSTWRGWLAQLALVSPCALLGTAPLTAFHFHAVSLAAVLANPLVVPIFGSAVVVIGLVGAVLEPFFPAGAAVAFTLAGVVLRPGIALVRRLAAPGWAAVDVPIPTVVELALLYALLAGVVLAARRYGRLLALMAFVGLLADAAWWARERFAPRTLRVTFLDVGQGDAAVAELLDGRVLVIDAGGFPGSEFDTGAAVVAPFLFRRKILRLDALVMTHAHPDHSGGLAYLLAHLRPREFWWTGVPGDGEAWTRLATAIAESGARVRVLAAGDLPAMAPDAPAVLHPPAAPGWRSLNDSSLTLRLGPPAGRVLLTGDIERRAEDRLVTTSAPTLPAAVLKVPHHGSRTSSTPAFVAAVAPRIAVISVGADNRYRLPAPEVEARYRARGTCVLRTDRCGAITVEVRGTHLHTHAMHPDCDCEP